MCVRRGVVYLYLRVSIRDWYLKVYTNMCTCACVYVCMCADGCGCVWGVNIP